MSKIMSNHIPPPSDFSKFITEKKYYWRGILQKKRLNVMEQIKKKKKTKRRGRMSFCKDNRMEHACTGTVATSLKHNKEEKALLISWHWWNLIINHMLNFHIVAYTIENTGEQDPDLSLQFLVTLNTTNLWEQFHFINRNTCRWKCNSLCTRLLNWTYSTETW